MNSKKRLLEIIEILLFSSLFFYASSLPAQAQPDITVTPESFEKLNPVASFSSPCTWPYDLAFDGTYLWNTDPIGQKIYQLDMSGNVVSSFDSPGFRPTGLAFDGTHLWNADSADGKIYKLDMSGNVISSFASPGSDPSGLAFDGTHLWNADSASGKIYQLDMTGNIVSSFASPGANPTGLTFDGTHLWNADDTDNKIYKLDMSGNIVSSFASPSSYPYGLAFDGTSLWNVDWVNCKIYKLESSTKVYLGLTKTESFTVKNSGDNDLMINTVSISGEDKTDFNIKSDSCSGRVLAASETCAVTVEFSPASEGEKYANLEIPSNDPDTPVLNVPLSGTGIHVPSGAIQFASTTYEADENGGSAIITVSRLGGSNGAVGVEYATSDGLGVEGVHYMAARGNLNWQDGDDAAKSFSVIIIDNSTAEADDKTINLTLSSPSGGAVLGPQNTAVLTVHDNEQLTQAWTPQVSGTTNHLNAVHFINANEGWVVGSNGTILHTINGGGDWSPQNSGLSDSAHGYHSVRFIDQNVGWAGGQFAVSRTTNGGAEWGGLEYFPPSDYCQSLFPVTSRTAWASGIPNTLNWRLFFRYDVQDDGSIVRKFWGQVSAFPTVLQEIYFVNAENGWAVGETGSGGLIVRISNASSDSPSFATQPNPSNQGLSGIHMLDINNGWVVGSDGTILKTVDGGTTWILQESGTARHLADVFFLDLNRGWVVGDGGLILITADGGITWEPQGSGTTVDLKSIFINSGLSGFAVGDSGVILTMSAPGFVVSPISNDTTEVGGQATFTLRLTTQPTADVTIDLSSSDPTEGTVSPSSVTFTTANWNVTHTVTATGVDDTIVDGNVAYSIVTAAATSTDSNYNGLNADDVSVTNNDNDTAGKVGDINGDGAVDLRDAVVALQTLSGVIPAGIRNDYASSGADVNGDGKIGMVEVIFILQSLVGLRTEQ